MKRLRTYLILIVALITVSCLEETKYLENELIQGNTVTFAANSSRVITRSGLTYTEFHVGTKYILFGKESEKSDWNEPLMYNKKGHENDRHLIEYGEDLFFSGRKMDFYGATLCKTDDTEDSYPLTEEGSSPIVKLSVGQYGEELPDLMYSRNLKECTAQNGILEMNFTHALSKVQIEVSKQEDGEDLAGATIKELTFVNTSSGGTLDLMTGKWTMDNTDASRNFFNGELTVSKEPTVIKDSQGNDKELLIFPNETSLQTVSLKIVVSTDKSGEKTIVHPLQEMKITEGQNGNTSTVSTYIFEQNHRYVLEIILLNDGVRVIAVMPQAYEWIDTPLEPYMGQPVNFGGLMWMDRNLGAVSADCENDWANTRGFYYQHGRNIPYIFDQEKFRNRNKAVKNEFRPHRAGQLDVGYEYFFTYNEKGEKVYGAVQGGTKTGHQRFMVDALTINGEKVGWVNNGSGWEWHGSYLRFVDDYGNILNGKIDYYANNDGGFKNDNFWQPQQKGKDGVDWTGDPSTDNRVPVWTGPQVTSSNIAINPGDPGIYHFIFDARFYHDHLQSGAWCVNDCDATSCEDDLVWKGVAASSTLSYADWLKGGCWETRQEDTVKVNYHWADKNGNPLPDNHPCPKGWRIPTKEDFAGIFPDHNIENSWAKNTNTIYVLNETNGDVLTGYKEAVIYGVDNWNRKVIYLIKRKGEEECYRLRLMWKNSNLTRNSYYDLNTAGEDAPMQYLEISRYPGGSDMNFDKYFNASVGEIVTTNSDQTASVQGSAINKEVRKMTGNQLNNLGFYTDFDWESATEKMLIPICGFIYTTLGVDGMFGDGDMTILRTTDWSNNYNVMWKITTGKKTYAAGKYPYNEALNWCAYVRTDRNTGLFSGSRKSLGDQIRCVRDVNAQ